MLPRPDTLSPFVFVPCTKCRLLLGYNSSSNTFVHVAEASGAVKSLGPVTVLPGIASEEAAVLSVAESQLYVHFKSAQSRPHVHD